MRSLPILVLIAISLAASGCAVVSVANAAVSVAATVVETGVSVAGTVVEGAVDLVTSSKKKD
jgi:hypothetical protein